MHKGHQILESMSLVPGKSLLYMWEPEGITETGTFGHLEYISRIPVLLDWVFELSFFASFQVQISLSLLNHAVQRRLAE